MTPRERLAGKAALLARALEDPTTPDSMLASQAAALFDGLEGMGRDFRLAMIEGRRRRAEDEVRWAAIMAAVKAREPLEKEAKV